MSVNGLLGEKKDMARLRLLLSDKTQQGSFCLTFNYRMVNHHVGKLRVLLDNNVHPLWEQSRSRDQTWQPELLSIVWEEEPPKSVSEHSAPRKFPLMWTRTISALFSCSIQTLTGTLCVLCPGSFVCPVFCVKAELHMGHSCQTV